MEKEIIKLKGTGDGVKIYLSKSEEFPEILHALYEKLDEFRKFFGSGSCNIYFIGRELSKEDKIRLESVTSTMLPKSTVLYGERTVFFRRKKTAEEYENEREEAYEKEQKEEHEKKLREVNEFVEERVKRHREAVATNFKRNRARYFEGDVSDGRRIESDGHLILKGNVLEGGTVAAAGNVIVLGFLYGNACAGELGSREAYIMALGFAPQSLSIADVVSQGEDYGEPEAKIALCDGENIFVRKFDINS